MVIGINPRGRFSHKTGKKKQLQELCGRVEQSGNSVVVGNFGWVYHGCNL